MVHTPRPMTFFLQAEPASGEFSTFRAEGSYDMVNSTVDVFNLRGSQGCRTTPATIAGAA